MVVLEYVAITILLQPVALYGAVYVQDDPASPIDLRKCSRTVGGNPFGYMQTLEPRTSCSVHELMLHLHVSGVFVYRRYYKCGGQVHLGRSFEDWEPGRTINCAKCEKVRVKGFDFGLAFALSFFFFFTPHACAFLLQDWGYEIKLKQVIVVPCLKIKSFLLKTPKESRTVKQWKQVEFQVKEFDFTNYANQILHEFDRN